MSEILRRGVGVETLTLEAFDDTDEQGLPSYDSPVDIEGRVVHEDSVARTGSGEEVATVASIWVDAGQDPLPAERDRIETSRVIGIVVTRAEGKRLNGVIDHIMVELKEE